MRIISPILAIVLMTACGKTDEDNDGFDVDVDCNDNNAAVFPGATEKCDGVDNDCDGEIDGQYAVGGTIQYLDADADGYGGSAGAVISCEAIEGYAEKAGDCDDANADVNPGAAEVCNDLDDDCNGLADDEPTDAGTYYADLDGDEFGSNTNMLVACEQPDGYLTESGDCNDVDEMINPSATEVCDMVDNNCDGTIDEETAEDARDWYSDSDGDGYGNPDVVTRQCYIPENHSENNEDCDDTNEDVNPGVDEECFDGIDNNCNDLPDQCSYTGYTSLEDYTAKLSSSDPVYMVKYGDFNQDGYTDRAAMYGGSYPSYAGQVSVSYGDGSIPSSLTVDATISGDTSLDYHRFGYGFGVVDMDADGVDDLAAGAAGYTFSSSTRHTTGSLNVVYGDSTANWTSASIDTMITALTADAVDSEADLDGFGWQTVNVGDLDGDGNDDLVIGAPYNSSGGTGGGAVYVVYGGAMPTDMSAEAELYATTSSGSSTSSCAGASTYMGSKYSYRDTILGFDFNGDGSQDLAVGAHSCEYTSSTNSSQGVVFVAEGDGATRYTGDQEINDVTTVAFYGAGSYEYFGENMHAFDENDDGYDDLLVYYDDNTVALFHGDGASGWVSGDSTTATASLSGSYYSLFGRSMSHGDIDGDGDDELLIAAPYEDVGGAFSTGAIHVFESGTFSSAASLEDTDHTFYGSASQYLGGYYNNFEVVDVDNDGVDDIVTGAGSYPYGDTYIFQGVSM